MKKKGKGHLLPLVEFQGELQPLSNFLPQKIVKLKIAVLPKGKKNPMQRTRIFIYDPRGIEVVHVPGEIFATLNFFEEENYHHIVDYNGNFLKKEIVNDPLGRIFKITLPVKDLEELEVA